MAKIRGKIGPSIPTFKCGICGKIYFVEDHLKAHFLLHLKKKLAFKCEVCGKVLSRRKKLDDHMILHSEKVCKCTKCRRKFVSKAALSQHKCSQEPKSRTPTTHSCKICNKEFSRLRILRDHVKCHVSDKSFKCGICNRCFPLKSLLKSHLFDHTKELPYKCEKCSKAYASKSSLKFHMRIHPSEQVWRCEICGDCFLPKIPEPDEVPKVEIDVKTFSVNPSLDGDNYVNFSSHLESKFMVDYFDISLEDHNYSYSHERQYRCDHCEKVFLANPTLEDHSYVEFTSSWRKYKCNVCKKLYSNYVIFLSHKEFHKKGVVSDSRTVFSRLQAHAGHVPQLKIDVLLDLISMYM